MTEPGDEWVTDDSSLAGSLARVVRVADNSEVVYAMFQNGNLARLVANGPTLIEPGDVVLIGNERWIRVEDDLWHEPKGVGVVRQLLDDDRLLIEAPGGLMITRQRGSATVAPGNTVSFSVDEGPSKSCPTRLSGSETEKMMTTTLVASTSPSVRVNLRTTTSGVCRGRPKSSAHPRNAVQPQGAARRDQSTPCPRCLALGASWNRQNSPRASDRGGIRCGSFPRERTSNRLKVCWRHRAPLASNLRGRTGKGPRHRILRRNRQHRR